jgi:hypothetical protein
MHFAAVLEHSPKSGLFEAELSFDHPKWVLYLGTPENPDRQHRNLFQRSKPDKLALFRAIYDC